MSWLAATALQPIVPTLPIARWGMDIVGPMPTTREGFRFAMVAVQYFTKWVEVEPLTAIRDSNIIMFF